MKNKETALNIILNLSKPNSFYTVLSALLLHKAYRNNIITGMDLFPKNRLLNLVKVLENDYQRVMNGTSKLYGRGVQPPTAEKLSHYILEINERFSDPIQEIPNTLSVGITQSA